MKALLGKLRFSRKLLLIMGGFIVLCGGSGAAAVFIGADTLLGPSYEELNGFACTEVQKVEIRKKDRFWVRKYITTEAASGEARVKTALRVAQTVYETEKPDLVQVVVLAADGPTSRAEIRGRAIGADVLYVPNPAKLREEKQEVFTARYVDTTASRGGRFYGEKITMPEGEIAALFGKLDDKTDCVKPVIEGAVDPHAPAGHEAAPAGHGEAAPAAGHGDAAPEGGHGEAAGSHGEAADGHGEAAPEHGAADAHGDAAPAEGEHGKAEGGGWMSSILGMVGLGGDEPAAPADGHGAAGDAHGAPSGDAHGTAAEDAHGTQPVEGAHDTTEHGAAAAKDAHGEAPAEAAHGEAPAETPEQVSDPHAAPAVEHSADGSDHEAAPADGHGAAEAHAADPAHEAPAEPAHGDAAQAEPAHAEEAKADAPPAEPAAGPSADGEGWFSKIKSMVMAGAQKGADQPPEEIHSDAMPDAASEGASNHGLDANAPDADAAGADWLAKFKAKPPAVKAETQADASH